MATLLSRMDAIQVHALAAAAAAGGATFTDVQVGAPSAKGWSVRVFYAGERQAPHFRRRTLNSLLVGQAIIVRAYFPLETTGTTQQRQTEGIIGVFVKELRTRILGDSQLGGESVDLDMGYTKPETVTAAGVKYTITDTEIVVDYDEYTLAP